MTPRRKTIRFLGFGVLLLLAFHLYSAGLFRGLDKGHAFHFDSPKQTVALWNYMHWQYLWYKNDPIFDGYPYGLNLVDALIMRAGVGVTDTVARHLNPDLQTVRMQQRQQLYYWGCVLRHPCRNQGIGVDLFTVLTILMLSLYQRTPRIAWLILAGFACGFGFACKYHGALAFFIIGVFLLLNAPVSIRRVASFRAQNASYRLRGICRGICGGRLRRYTRVMDRSAQRLAQHAT